MRERNDKNPFPIELDDSFRPIGQEHYFRDTKRENVGQGLQSTNWAAYGRPIGNPSSLRSARGVLADASGRREGKLEVGCQDEDYHDVRCVFRNQLAKTTARPGLVEGAPFCNGD